MLDPFPLFAIQTTRLLHTHFRLHPPDTESAPHIAWHANPDLELTDTSTHIKLLLPSLTILFLPASLSLSLLLFGATSVP
jgi:hypothetical protein